MTDIKPHEPQENAPEEAPERFLVTATRTTVPRDELLVLLGIPPGMLETMTPEDQANTEKLLEEQKKEAESPRNLRSFPTVEEAEAYREEAITYYKTLNLDNINVEIKDLAKTDEA